MLAIKLNNQMGKRNDALDMRGCPIRDYAVTQEDVIFYNFNEISLISEKDSVRRTLECHPAHLVQCNKRSWLAGLTYISCAHAQLADRELVDNERTNINRPLYVSLKADWLVFHIILHY